MFTSRVVGKMKRSICEKQNCTTGQRQPSVCIEHLVCAKHLNHREELIEEETDSCNSGDGEKKELKRDLEMQAGQGGDAGSRVGLFSAAGAQAWKPGSLSSRN